MNIAGKRYKVKSRVRFTIFIAIVIIFMVTMTNTFLGFNDASSLTMQEYLNLEIQAGDTLWSIANQYMPESMDTREAVYKLCELNSIKADNLQPGQVILVPIYI